jgi:hypothetical protein
LIVIFVLARCPHCTVTAHRHAVGHGHVTVLADKESSRRTPHPTVQEQDMIVSKESRIGARSTRRWRPSYLHAIACIPHASVSRIMSEYVYVACLQGMLWQRRGSGRHVGNCDNLAVNADDVGGFRHRRWSWMWWAGSWAADCGLWAVHVREALSAHLVLNYYCHCHCHCHRHCHAQASAMTVRLRLSDG